MAKTIGSPAKKKFKHVVPKLKSIFSAIGTGAGVAWPLFGVLSSSLSFRVGGLTTIGLGSLCSILFFTISLPVFWISFQNTKKRNKQLMNKLFLVMESILRRLQENYLERKKNNSRIGLSDFIIYLNLLEKFYEKNNNEFSLRLIQLLQDQVALTGNNQFQLNKKTIKNLVQVLVEKIPGEDLPAKQFVSTFFLAFAGVFGSIAGCSSGIMGLLASLGVVSGFHAMPLIGIGILIFAVVIGLAMAIKSVHAEAEAMKKKAILKNIKAFDQEIHQQPSFVPDAEDLNINERKKNQHAGLTRRAKRHSLPGVQDWIPLSIYSSKETRDYELISEEPRKSISSR